jgi:hypothetical protein
MTEQAQNLGYFFSHGKSDEMYLTKNVLGYMLGEFFTNSSGHREGDSMYISINQKHLCSASLLKASSWLITKY